MYSQAFEAVRPINRYKVALPASTEFHLKVPVRASRSHTFFIHGLVVVKITKLSLDLQAFLPRSFINYEKSAT